jgi:hypothetical protein
MKRNAADGLFAKPSRKAVKMETLWSYKHYQVSEGLKPGSKHFQYFFVVSKDGAKKCNYCVWIQDDALNLFHESKEFSSILSSFRDQWSTWVKGKIDQEIFGTSPATRKTGQKSILLKRKPPVPGVKPFTLGG